jgi:eukaryotic-like serine/threonine-protein kinase
MSICINPRCSQPNISGDVLFCQSCGSELLLEGRYRVTKPIGSGGFGTTYEVKSQGVNKILKILVNTSSKAVQLFQRETEILSQLSHEGIPRLDARGYFTFHPKGSQDILHCFVMQKMEGENLWEYIKQRSRRPIDGQLAVQWLVELSMILDLVHGQNILHRDIKPQNIILKPDGKLALIDFGAAYGGGGGTEVATQARGGTQAATHASRGTSISSAGYTPMEQADGHAVKQSDIFALGRTFVFLLTAKDIDRMYVDGELAWRNHTFNVPPQLLDLLDRMMSWKPSLRPTDAKEILQQLGENRPTPKNISYPQVPNEYQIEDVNSPITRKQEDTQTQKKQSGFRLFILRPIAILICFFGIFMFLLALGAFPPFGINGPGDIINITIILTMCIYFGRLLWGK